MKVRVNNDACIGCGACVAVAEDLFEINEDGLSEAKNQIIPDTQKEQAINAIDSCPTGAIEEIEEATEQAA